MAVDMFVWRFRQELSRLPKYLPVGRFDPEITLARLPAVRAVFTGGALIMHSAGYRLPAFDDFSRRYLWAIKHHPSFAAKFANYFDGTTPKPGLLFRLSRFYESFMTELYLYSVLAEALEDRHKIGLVLYDARVDWKQKTDAIVFCNGE